MILSEIKIYLFFNMRFYKSVSDNSGKSFTWSSQLNGITI